MNVFTFLYYKIEVNTEYTFFSCSHHWEQETTTFVHLIMYS